MKKETINKDAGVIRAAGKQNAHGKGSSPAPRDGRISGSPYMTAQRKALEGATGRTIQEKNDTGMPDEVKAKMESSFDRDFSDVRVHAGSARAPEVGALAYTQGSDVHFAPGQFSPDSSAGQKLLGHELAHVVQQSDGRVSPTTEVAGIPVNDNPSLEEEADRLGSKAAG